MMRIVVLLTAVAAVILAAGCGGSREDRPTEQGREKPTATQLEFPTEDVELTMWWWGEQEAPGSKEWLAETVRLYEQKRPNVKIKTVLQSSENLISSFQNAAAAKKGPDIQYMWGSVYVLENGWDGNIVPVSDYIERDELAHYSSFPEHEFDGKTWIASWYKQPVFPVLYRKDLLEKAGVEPPQDWEGLLSACRDLNAAGITPIAAGVKDGWFGGWLFQMIAAQSLRSVNDLTAAVVGEQSFADPQHAEWWKRVEELRDNKCFNDDIHSTELFDAQQLWKRGKAAFTVVAGSDVKNFTDAAGPEHAGLMAAPTWADGPFADGLGSTAHGYTITSWSKYPQVAADFIKFMHTPERLEAFFAQTGTFPADDRFDSSLIKDEHLKQMYDLSREFKPYVENYIPTEVDFDGVFKQTQLVLSGNQDAAGAAEAMQDIAKRVRVQRRDYIRNFEQWHQSLE